MLRRIPEGADIDKTRKMINSLLGDIEMILATNNNRISKLENDLKAAEIQNSQKGG